MARRPAAALHLASPGQSQQPRTQLARGVYIVPSASGTTRIMGMTTAGVFVAEYACPTEDFTEHAIVAMERAVRRKERAHQIRIVP